MSLEAAYENGQIVVERRHDMRIGKITHTWDAQHPVLYRLINADTDWYAYEEDLREATEQEKAAYNGTAKPAEASEPQP